MKDIQFTCIEIKESMTGVKVIFSLERFKNKNHIGFTGNLPFGQLELAYIDLSAVKYKVGETYLIDIK